MCVHECVLVKIKCVCDHLQDIFKCKNVCFLTKTLSSLDNELISPSIH